MAEAVSDKGSNPPFGAEYAKSGRASCKGCKEPIAKDSLRMSLRLPSRFFDGLQDNWFHYECFWKRAKAELLTEGNIRGMEALKWDDQEKLRKRMAEVKETATDAPTPKSHIPRVELAKTGAGKCFECKQKIDKGSMRIQVKASNFHPACLKKLGAITCAAEEITDFDLLSEENQATLQDVFGKAAQKRKGVEEATSSTPKKKTKTDDLDEKEKKKLKKQSETLWSVKENLRKNLSKDEVETILSANGRFKRKRDNYEAVLDQLTDCFVFGIPERCPECEDGVLFYSTSQHTYACTGHVSEYTSCTYTNRVPNRTEIEIPKDVKKGNDFLKKWDWPTLSKRRYATGSDVIVSAPTSNPLDKIKKRRVNEAETKDDKPSYVKNGCTVDGNCEVAEIAHVFIDDKKTVYQATLGYTDITQNKNSYYKLQLLKHDKKDEYYLFRSWGRIGTTTGGYKTEYFEDDLKDAKREFKRLFLEKSKNDWKNRHNFQKKPGRMDILEMELGEKTDVKKFSLEESKSTRPLPVKKLVHMIFDIDTINESLKALDLDLDKMPLGKLSKGQILNAYKVLKELDSIFDDGVSKTEILDASNRFYTLIPHATGMEAPRPLDNIEIIREKTKMLDDLLEIELAYRIIKSEEEEAAQSQESIDPIDAHYEKLKCEIEVVERDSEEFKLVEDYTRTTHAPTHDAYKLAVKEVFKIERAGEAVAFKKDIGNVQLLWHGSRLSNYAGILSQGLRIAPPEAPMNGYMFGKGIYFADLVSKSANYCYVQPGSQPEGLLLLCDVALGQIQEEKNAKNIRKLKGGRSSVKGLGSLIPETGSERTLPDGVTVPIGKPTKSSVKGLSLIHNEYIVYDEAQVKIRYLVQTEFVFK